MAQSHEENWPTATNPRYLLKLSRVRPSGRQYLLLVCAVARYLWPQQSNDLGLRVLGALERFAFAQPRKGVQMHVWREVVRANVPEIAGRLNTTQAHNALWLHRFETRLGAFSQIGPADVNVIFDCTLAESENHARRQTVAEVANLFARLSPTNGTESRLTVAQLRDEIVSRYPPERRTEARSRWARVRGRPSAQLASEYYVQQRAEQCLAEVNARACDLIREVFGNPFRPAAIRPEWLACNHGAARHIAQKIAATGDFTDLPILADALEDAGCCDQELLGHLREPKAHVPGCWALDAVLGK